MPKGKILYLRYMTSVKLFIYASFAVLAVRRVVVSVSWFVSQLRMMSRGVRGTVDVAIVLSSTDVDGEGWIGSIRKFSYSSAGYMDERTAVVKIRHEVDRAANAFVCDLKTGLVHVSYSVIAIPARGRVRKAIDQLLVSHDVKKLKRRVTSKWDRKYIDVIMRAFITAKPKLDDSVTRFMGYHPDNGNISIHHLNECIKKYLNSNH